MTKKRDAAITIHGPMWQYECDRCGHMDETYDTRAAAAAAARHHDCIIDSIGFKFHLREGDGGWLGTIGHEWSPGGQIVFEIRKVKET